MRVASIQMTVVEGDKARTLERATERVHQVRGVDLVILPELWNIGFMSFDRYTPEAEDKNGPTMKVLLDGLLSVGFGSRSPVRRIRLGSVCRVSKRREIPASLTGTQV